MAKLVIIVSIVLAATCRSTLSDRVLDRLRARVSDLEKVLDERQANFWISAVAFNSTLTCVPEFAADLQSNYTTLPHEDKNEWLYKKVRERTVEYCSQQFDHLSGDLHDVMNYQMEVEDRTSGRLVDLPDLEDFTDSFYADTIENYEDEMARRVTRLVRSVWHNRACNNVRKFKECYLEISPCNHLYDELDKSPEMAAYAKFLRLAAIPEYYPSTGWSHIAYVDVVAACDHIHSSDTVITTAFRRYTRTK